MGRLIDADDAINIFTNRLFETLKTNLPCVTATENQICLETCYKVAKHEIDDIPTAYDAEKVVEELEVLAECNEECKKNFYYGQGCNACLWHKIFEIVRKGDKQYEIDRCR